MEDYILPVIERCFTESFPWLIFMLTLEPCFPSVSSPLLSYNVFCQRSQLREILFSLEKYHPSSTKIRVCGIGIGNSSRSASTTYGNFRLGNSSSHLMSSSVSGQY